MAEYIEKEAAIDACFDGWNNAADDCARNIRRLPAADVVKVKHGKWEHDRCTECGKSLDDLFSGEFYYDEEELKYCPNCGARMGREQK